jgi:hypothetical protein
VARARRDGAGGITGLVELIDRHGEALEADLQREYHRSLLELHKGTMSFRELSWLVKGLPGDGTALWRAGRRVKSTKVGKTKATPPPDEYWTPERELQAQTIDALNVLSWHNTKDGKHGRNPPKPIRRPGVEQGERTGTPVSAAEAMRRLRPRGVVADGDEPHAEPEGPQDAQRDAPSGER